MDIIRLMLKSLSNHKEADMLSAEAHDPQILCTQKNASNRGKFEPFGLQVLASKDLTEQTAAFFRVYGTDNNFRVLMCAYKRRFCPKLSHPQFPTRYILKRERLMNSRLLMFYILANTDL
ncbi:hypothetical protein R6Q59_002776 [Mikania micrantha]